MKLYLLILLLVAVTQATDKIVCYYGSWSTYRKGNGKFNVEDIDVQKCTHIIYAFTGINSDGSIKVLDPWNDINLEGLKRFNALKSRKGNLKTLIAIGGWNEGSTGFSSVAANPSLRNNFVQSALTFMETYGFDGFDLDWEYPAQRDGSPNDKVNFITLVKLMRERFDSSGKKYLLTAAVGATATAADASYNVPELSRYLDFINLMTYDFHGAFDGYIGQNAPLYPSNVDVTEKEKEKNVVASVSAWLARGAAANKIVLGMGIYGRSFTLSSSRRDLGSPISGGGLPGPYTGEAGILGYNEICEMQKQGGWTEIWDDQQKVPYIYKDNQWVGFDNPRSIKLKVEYAKSMKLGGVMVWSVETDDFRGICGVKNPIMSAIVEAMGNINSGPIVENPIVPVKPPENKGSVCNNVGYMRDPINCAIFYLCEKIGNSFIQYQFKCPESLAFDLRYNICNYSNQVAC